MFFFLVKIKTPLRLFDLGFDVSSGCGRLSLDSPHVFKKLFLMEAHTHTHTHRVDLLYTPWF